MTKETRHRATCWHFELCRQNATIGSPQSRLPQ